MNPNLKPIALWGAAAFVPVASVVLLIFLQLVQLPWESEAEWHLRRYLFWRHEPGTSNQRERHRQALIALGPQAVPPIAERVVGTSTSKHDREILVYLLRSIGPVANRAIDDMLVDSEYPFGKVSRTDQDRRLLYAQFAAFRDWDAFDKWLSHMEDFKGDLFDEARLEHHIESLEGSGIPDYCLFLSKDDRWVVNPAFVEWWRSNRSRIEADDAQHGTDRKAESPSP